MTNDTPGLPEQAPVQESPVRQILKFLSSMQLGIILLLLLAVISIYAATWKEHQVAISSVYSSWWFIGIMVFTALNLLLCTVERIRPTWRQAFNPRRVMKAEAIKRMPVNRSIKVKQAGTQPLERLEQVFRANRLKSSVSDSPDGQVLFGESGRYGYFGSVVTHLSLLLILLAAMFGGMTGFETRDGGYAGTIFNVPQGNFQAVINNVTLQYLPEGPQVRPRAISDVTVSRNGNVIKQGKISINEPLRFGGIALYHTTFLWVSEVTVSDPDSGTVLEQFKLYERDRYYMHEMGFYIDSLAFFPDFSMTGMGQPITRSYATTRPVLAYQVGYPNGKTEQWALLDLNEPQLVETENGPIVLTLNGFENAAVFNIIKNLGRPYLFAGSLLMVIGLYMSFFLFPRRFWAVFDSKSSSFLVGGRSRNKLGLESVFDRIEEEISKREEE
ncbi:MAG: cytochrome c biogenesis protein ResB [Dethiobacter sp.]|nr:cytochrome c biogenesis protein ResB [Dethiobacter sp.]